MKEECRGEQELSDCAEQPEPSHLSRRQQSGTKRHLVSVPPWPHVWVAINCCKQQLISEHQNKYTHICKISSKNNSQTWKRHRHVGIFSQTREEQAVFHNAACMICCKATGINSLVINPLLWESALLQCSHGSSPLFSQWYQVLLASFLLSLRHLCTFFPTTRNTLSAENKLAALNLFHVLPHH